MPSAIPSRSVWVRTTAVVIALGARSTRIRPPRPGRPPSAAASMSATGSPCPSQANVSRLPFGPGRPDDAKPWKRRPRAGASPATETRARRRSSAERTTPPRPTSSRPSSNCGFTIASSSPAGARHRATAGSTFASEMNETSTVTRSGAYSSWSGVEAARVDALHHGHPRVVAEAPVELAVAHVERDHVRGAALQEAVRETPGRCTDVEAPPCGRRRCPGRRGRSRASCRRAIRTPGPCRPSARPHPGRALPASSPAGRRARSARARPARTRPRSSASERAHARRAACRSVAWPRSEGNARGAPPRRRSSSDPCHTRIAHTFVA